MPPAQHDDFPPPSASAHNNEHGSAGKPIPEAVLVYHESAHSIVFRDHLRRQLSAIRRTSTAMENSSHSTHSMSQEYERNRHAVNSAHGIRSEHDGSSSHQQGRRRHNTLAIHSEESSVADTDGNDVVEVAYKEDTEGGYKPSDSSDVGYESAGSRGSYNSLDKSDHSKKQSHLHFRKKKEKESKPTLQAVAVANFQPVIEPLERLELNSSDVFLPLLEADPNGSESLDMTDTEKEVVGLLRDEKAAVKTVRNADWTAFLDKFAPSADKGVIHEHHPAHRSVGPGPEIGHKVTEDNKGYPFNSFVTSTSLLPSLGKKMRCFGSTNEYPVGVVFALPSAFPNDESEDASAKRTRTWSWPSGYSAKTEFNIDRNGNLINGREEALVPLSGLRKMNHSYLHDTDYFVGGRMVHGGLHTIPYNEVYIRVGGVGRISMGVDVATGEECIDGKGTGRSFDHGVGLPIALFVRDANYRSLVGLLRTRSRFSHIFGREAGRGMPLLFITPETGVRVLTESLQKQLLKTMAWDLNPFQNAYLAHHCGVDNTSETHLRQKLEELLDLDDDNLKQVLTPEEMARIAGGFGATDESVAQLLHQALQRDILDQEHAGSHAEDSGHSLQDLVNEGLAFALRASDYHTSRQLLILYTLISSRRHKKEDSSNPLLEADGSLRSDSSKGSPNSKNWREVEKNMQINVGSDEASTDLRKMSEDHLKAPPPPPLDTDRLRSATNSDGLLAVLGAAQVLKAMQDGSAKRRVKEAIESIEEWIENGEQSVAFRVASWRDQRAAQGDLKIAMESDSNFMAFISNKSIANRKKFAKHLRDAAEVSEFDSLQFLHAIHNIISQMHSPCLRLELLQYILGLDNRYSVAHVKRSVELAATCLNISESDVFHGNEGHSNGKLLAL
ncbi:hypothetical protein HJC23_002186 [Cyclotella cryptica]|uniref:Uncharacterized protein n=1 Tax=Cyclotella cryptica TaxID=29204 RepID=A0ABD3QCN0_9STRA